MNEQEVQTAKRAESLIGNGYIYGANGQICSPAFRQQQARQYPEYEKKILQTGAKWDGVRVWDCATFTRTCAKAGGVTLVSGATSQWNKTDWAEKGEIQNAPSGNVCFLYKREDSNRNKMSHTGVYLGNGYFVHAKGTAYGVIKQKLSEYNWTHYAIPKWGEGSEKNVLYEATVKSQNGGNVKMRKGPGTDYGILTYVDNGTHVEVLEELDGWKKICVNGDEGYMMEQFIVRDGNQENTDAQVTSETVTIPKGVADAFRAAAEALLKYL